MDARDWGTLSGRIAWVLETRKERVKSERAWGIAAGLSPATVNQIVKRGGSLKADSAGALADVAGVDADWLARGVGEPERPAATASPISEDTWGQRRIGAKGAIKQGADVAVVDRIRAAARYNTDEYRTKPARFWRELFMSETIRELRRNPAALQSRMRDAQRDRAEVSAEPDAPTKPTGTQRRANTGTHG